MTKRESAVPSPALSANRPLADRARPESAPPAEDGTRPESALPAENGRRPESAPPAEGGRRLESTLPGDHVARSAGCRDETLLRIENLHVQVGGQPILQGVDLAIRAGETHAIMGPNGSGKSTLANVLAGREDYRVTEGRVCFDGEVLTELAPEDRARLGLFLGFQYPVEIPGLASLFFYRAAVNAQRKQHGLPEYDAVDFIDLVRQKTSLLGLDFSLVHRSVNSGFSGGEKKRNEILQMALLEPRLAILDETDSGLDIDALKTVAGGVNALRSAERSLLIITHYQRLLKYIVPDYVHVLVGGRIVRSGDRHLAEELEREGYAMFGAEAMELPEAPV